MRRFFLRSTYFILFTVVLLEVLTRLIIDPVYFYTINPYLSPSALTDFTPDDLLKPEPSRVDWLFIGSSRVAASVDEKIFTEANNTRAVNTGRGYFTGGTHYLALKKMIQKHPEFIDGAKVLIELPGGVNYQSDSARSIFDVYEGSSHFLLPHISFRDLKNFWNSRNSTKEKARLTLQFFSSSYRTFPFIKEYKSRMYNRLLRRFKSQKSTKLSNKGGIKTESIDLAKQTAVNVARRQMDGQKEANAIRIDDLNHSIIAAFHRLIEQHGGELILFEVPLHSIQKEVYATAFSKKNKAVFRDWAELNKVKIITMDDFATNDEDFPDYWHLSVDLKPKFSRHLLYKLK